MKIAKGPPFPQRRREASSVSREAAVELAHGALAFLAQDMERLERFFSLTGLDPSQIRALAGQPGFALAVLDHLASDETLLLAFVSEAGIAPETIGRARHALGGGDA